MVASAAVVCVAACLTVAGVTGTPQGQPVTRQGDATSQVDPATAVLLFSSFSAEAGTAPQPRGGGATVVESVEGPPLAGLLHLLSSTNIVDRQEVHQQLLRLQQRDEELLQGEVQLKRQREREEQEQQRRQQQEQADRRREQARLQLQLQLQERDRLLQEQQRQHQLELQDHVLQQQLQQVQQEQDQQREREEQQLVLQQRQREQLAEQRRQQEERREQQREQRQQQLLAQQQLQEQRQQQAQLVLLRLQQQRQQQQQLNAPASAPATAVELSGRPVSGRSLLVTGTGRSAPLTNLQPLPARYTQSQVDRSVQTLNISPSGSNSGPLGEFVGTCSSALTCVPRAMCNPYTGFLQGSLLFEPSGASRRPTVALLQCYRLDTGGVGDGVCCRARR